MDALLDQIFSKAGPLAQSRKEFEERPGQQGMARQILDAYQDNQIALIEAGTGIGKSLAYLIPAILWAAKHKEKTVIATFTIALQEQLLYKDIPMALKALDLDLKAVIVKGMGNYLCLRKLHEIEEQDAEIEKIALWSQNTKEGSHSNIPFPVSVASWERVNAESQSCHHSRCPYFNECFFFKARRRADEAQILVANHHIVFADMAARKRKDYKEEKAILPHYKRIVVDEAHHFEDVALNAFSKRIDRLNLIRLLGRLHSELHPERSRFMLIRKEIKQPISSLIPLLEIDLPAAKSELVTKINAAFQDVEAFCRSHFYTKELRWRLRSEQFSLALIKNEIAPQFAHVSELLKKFIQSLIALAKEIEKEFPTHALEVQAVALRLDEQAEGLETFFVDDTSPTRVRWVEANLQGSNLTLIDAQLDVAAYLKKEFFETLSTIAFCSATLACAGTFNLLRDSLGIGQDLAVTENIYQSPFDYESNALLAIPTDLPDPAESAFMQRAVATIARALEISQGGTFVLFTSYDMLRTVYQHLKPFALEKGFHFLQQGETSRQLLLEQFKSKPKAVLFGTDSFWEGVDIPGNGLRLVIITKLPFRVPSDPLMQALSEQMDKAGKNAFLDYQVPQAVIKFKQGFGRLIRTRTDRGAILCLDKRLMSKSYGKLFLKSLPPSKVVSSPEADLLKELVPYIRP